MLRPSSAFQRIPSRTCANSSRSRSASREVNGKGGLTLRTVDGHQDQDLPSDGHEVAVMAITEGDRIRWSSRREICSDRRIRVAWSWLGVVPASAQIASFCALRREQTGRLPSSGTASTFRQDVLSLTRLCKETAVETPATTAAARPIINPATSPLSAPMVVAIDTPAGMPVASPTRIAVAPDSVMITRDRTENSDVDSLAYPPPPSTAGNFLRHPRHARRGPPVATPASVG